MLDTGTATGLTPIELTLSPETRRDQSDHRLRDWP
jgi:hypothetical protein